MSSYNSDEFSDDEVLCGKPKNHIELKKTLKKWDTQLQQTLRLRATSAVSSPKNSGDLNESLKILQAHSQPNLLPKTQNSDLVLSELKNSPGWDMKLADDNLIEMENMVTKLCVSPRNEEKTELNNTLDMIEYILNNPPKNSKEKNEKEDDIKLMTEIKNQPNLSDLSQQKIDGEVKKHEAYNSPETPRNTPVRTDHQLHKSTEGTPRVMKQKLIFKTPVQPLSLKKPYSLKKTPGQSNAYQHIISPVASYIKNCPTATLVKDVRPKKPLPSSIPKFVPPAKPSNKENVNLPSVAYKSAKKTRVIDVPEQQQLPQSHWVKNSTTALPRPLLMKHDHRELNFAKKKLMPQQEDSFADLSCHQADVSVCVQKSPFKKL